MSTPGPRIHGGSRPGPDRVQVDVPNQFKQVSVGIDQDRLVPALKNVSRAALCVVDPFRVAEGNVLHDAGERHVASLHDEMDMICHQAETMYATAELFHCILENEIQPVPVPIIEEYGISSIAAKDDVIDGAGIVDAGFACHGGNISENGRKASLTPSLFLHNMNMSGEMLIGIEEKLESVLEEQCWRHVDLSSPSEPSNISSIWNPGYLLFKSPHSLS